MRFGLSLPIHGQFANPQLHVDLATAAEEAGWDGYFVWDHIAWKIGPNQMAVTDPWITLAAIAQATERISLGPMVTPLARRRPWKVARETVALDHLSQERLILGVGLGTFTSNEFSAFGDEGDDKRRGRQLDEALNVITGLWRGTPFSHQGEFYTIEEAHFTPTPRQQPRIPIWVAGTWHDNGKHKPFRRAARYDGTFPLMPGRDATPEDFRAIGALIAQHRPADQPIDMICGRKLDEDSLSSAVDLNAFADAGVTWWMCGAMSDKLTAREAERLIRRGPPIS